ncbi:MAG: drug resistance transporter, EmrB/QacA subfamily [Chthonomonadales bacterium]|nr:drug resistance transporter, EmrB/QacA subfamily [Chthonomonadales bacterium]
MSAKLLDLSAESLAVRSDVSLQAPMVPPTPPGGVPQGVDAIDTRPLYARISPGLRALIVVTVMAATIMEFLDTSIVNVAIPSMQGNLGATLDDIGWVSTGYIISNVIVLPLTGWLSDYFGRKRYLTYSIILFTVASLGCGISHSLVELIFWRIIQGAGGAAFFSISQATLMEVFPPAKRGIAQAIFGLGVAVAPTLGPTLGGYLTDNYSWPWIFFVNVPVGILAAILTFSFVPNSAAAGQKRKADFVGIGLLAIGLGCLQTILERGEREDWFESGFIIGLALCAVAGIGAFLWWVLRPANTHPAVNLRVITNRNLAAGTLYAFAFGFALYGMVFVTPQFLQNVQNHTAQQAGMLLLPSGLATAGIFILVGMLVNRVDTRILIGLGAAFTAMAMFRFHAILTLTTPDEAYFLPLTLRGIGVGLQIVPLSVVTLGTLKPQQVGEGAGIYNLFRQLGGSFGIAMLTTLISRRNQFHYARLGEHLNVYDPFQRQELAHIQAQLVQRGMTPFDAQAGALKVLANLVQRQAAALTFMDVYAVLAWVGIGTLLLLVLFQRPRNGKPSADAH